VDDAAVPGKYLRSWQSRYDWLRMCMQGLDLLLMDPQPGLATWCEAYDRGRRRITAAASALAAAGPRDEREGWHA
jgi:hypothetical protein